MEEAWERWAEEQGVARWDPALQLLLRRDWEAAWDAGWAARDAEVGKRRMGFAPGMIWDVVTAPLRKPHA